MICYTKRNSKVCDKPKQVKPAKKSGDMDLSKWITHRLFEVNSDLGGYQK